MIYGKLVFVEDPSVLIGSLMVGILPYGSSPTKRPQHVIFFESRQIQDLWLKMPYNKTLLN